MSHITQDINVEKIEISIQLLKQHIEDSNIEPLTAALEALKQEPDNESHLTQLSETFTSIGILQGAVLTDAPYISTLVSGDLFQDDWE